MNGGYPPQMLIRCLSNIRLLRFNHPRSFTPRKFPFVRRTDAGA